MSMRRPSASSRSSIRQRNAWVSTRVPGYHLKGTETRSASCPRARSSSTSRSVKISAPPRANGTCGLHTAILTLAPLEASSEALASRARLAAHRLELGLQPVDLLLEVVDEPKRRRVERPLVVRQRLDIPAHELAEDGLDRRADAAADARPEPQRAVRRDGPQTLRLRTGHAALLLVAGACTRVRARAAYFFTKRAEELFDVDRCSRRNPCRIAVFGVIRGHRGILTGV